MGLTPHMIFNSLNTAWSILLPHVKSIKDKEQYKKIMGDCYRIYWKTRQDKFSPSWWKEVTEEFLEYPKQYKGTIFYDFAEELSMGFLDYWEHCSKLNESDAIFYNCIQKAFIEEWIRIE